MSITDEPITEAQPAETPVIEPPAINRVDPLRDKLRAARAAATKEYKPLELRLPTEGLPLWAMFRVRDDYSANKKMVAEYENEPDEDQMELLVAAATLIQSCVGTFAVDEDGQRLDITDEHGQPIGLGKALCDYLGIAGVDNDMQGILTLYGEDHTMSLMTSFARLEKWAVDTGQKVDAGLLGN